MPPPPSLLRLRSWETVCPTGWEGVDTGENVTGDEREGQRRAAPIQWADRIRRKIDWRVSELDRSSGAPPLEPTRSAAQMPREARSSPAGPITNACGVRRREDAGRRRRRWEKCHLA